MKSKHITRILENEKLTDLSEQDLARVQTHIRDCIRCSRAYRAAKISSVLLKERAAETLEPSPFFEAKVINAIRARQAARQPAGSRLWQMWQAAKTLVSGLAAAVALLAVFSFFAPHTPDNQILASADNFYSAEAVFFNSAAPEDLTDAEILYEIYQGDNTGEKR